LNLTPELDLPQGSIRVSIAPVAPASWNARDRLLHKVPFASPGSAWGGLGCEVPRFRYRPTTPHPRSGPMPRYALVGALLAPIALAAPAAANQDVLLQTGKPEQWALQTGDYANQRFSKLSQITRDNVKNLKVAWTFSTGVLRGHEGSPLVIGDIMY